MKLKKSRFGVFDPSTQTQCTICTMDFEPNDDLSTPFACGHRFHRDCIDRWINRRNTQELRPNCATCKNEILVVEGAHNLAPVPDEEYFAAGGLAFEDQEENEQNYDNPPEERPDPVPVINPAVPIQRRREILMEYRTDWSRYYNDFMNYHILTRRIRSQVQIDEDSATGRDILATLNGINQMLMDLNEDDRNEDNNRRNVRRRLEPEFNSAEMEFGKRRKRSGISLNFINNAMKYLKTI